MARVLISQFYLHTPRSSANGMNNTCLVRIRVQFLVRDITSHLDQLSLAIPPWIGAIEYRRKGGDGLRREVQAMNGMSVGSR